MAMFGVIAAMDYKRVTSLLAAVANAAKGFNHEIL